MTTCKGRSVLSEVCCVQSHTAVVDENPTEPGAEEGGQTLKGRAHCTASGFNLRAEWEVLIMGSGSGQ